MAASVHRTGNSPPLFAERDHTCGEANTLETETTKVVTVANPRAAEHAVQFLDGRGAATIEHPGGTLLAHLARTHRQLLAWNASEDLALAGLCHATYGTDGFRRPLLDRSSRRHLIDVIGPTAEHIVYLYASCDREFLYPQIGATPAPTFRDRFTGATSTPSTEQLHHFLELTFANELDIVAASSEFAAEHGTSIAEMFNRCEAFVSPLAFTHFRSLLSTPTEIGGFVAPE
jgi:hypothetical protein